MKRTRQRFDRPEQEAPQFTSGCRQFEGEDLRYHERIAIQAEQQKEWVQEQKREHATQAEMDRAEEEAYAQQTAAITRMRGMLEDEATAKKAAMMRAVQEENKRLAQAKRDRESAWRADQQAQNQAELDATNNSDIMTENFATTQSKLGASRYVPYHFKELRPDQKAEIEATRAQQVRDNKEMRKFEKEEDAAWAAQQAANNQMLLQNEIDKQEQYRAMNA